MILIITQNFEATANDVVAALNKLGAPWCRLNFPTYADEWEIVLHPLDPESSELRRRDGTVIRASEVSAVWFWKAGGIRLPPDLDDGARTTAQRALRETLFAFLEIVGEHAFFVTPLRVMERATDKAWQLRVAKRHGFICPPTLVTNVPDEARAFAKAHGDVIFKMFHNDSTVPLENGEMAWIMTNKLTDEDLAELDALTLTPGIFQALVPKRFDLRVTIVGNDLFAAEIHSQVDARSAVDFRQSHQHDIVLPHHVHTLPPEVATRCLAVARELGLPYGAMDLVLTPDGEYVFLEVNPAGMFGWVEALTKLPITAALAAMLHRGSLG